MLGSWCLVQNFLLIGQRAFNRLTTEKWPLSLKSYIAHTTLQSDNALQFDWETNLKIVRFTVRGRCSSSPYMMLSWVSKLLTAVFTQPQSSKEIEHSFTARISLNTWTYSSSEKLLLVCFNRLSYDSLLQFIDVEFTSVRMSLSSVTDMLDHVKQ